MNIPEDLSDTQNARRWKTAFNDIGAKGQNLVNHMFQEVYGGDKLLT